MSDRLRTLLQHEADGVVVPPPPVQQVLSQGRTRRFRRLGVTGVAALGVATIVVGALMFGAQTARSTDDRIEPANELSLHGGAFSVGRTVHLDNSDRQPVRLDAEVRSLHYTSAGIVIRTVSPSFQDVLGPSSWALLMPDGELEPLDLSLGDRVADADPQAPYLAYADRDATGWAVVVHDVARDRRAARVHIEGDFTWGGWVAPPVALTGDMVYVGLDGAAATVNWRTGETGTSPSLVNGYPEVAGGHAVIRHRDGDVRVVDLADRVTLLSYPAEQGAHVTLSPDGRFAKVVLQTAPSTVSAPDLSEQEGFQVFELSTGDRTTFMRSPWYLGWTPDGHLLGATERNVTVCDPISGVCDSRDVDHGPGSIKLADFDYEG